MRNTWLTLKIGLLFTVILVLVLVGTLRLFGRVLGHDLIHELVSLRLGEASHIADGLERLLEDHALDDPAVCTYLREAGAGVGATVALVGEDGRPLACSGPPHATGAGHRWRKVRQVEFNGRPCEVDHRPPFRTYVPVEQGGAVVATLAMTPPRVDASARRAFHRGMLYIGLAALAGILGISVYVTAPLRRMSRSMDRIAAGDLDHRVRCRGRDDVAVMGRSFNAMADRVQGMIHGQKELAAGFSHELRSPLARMKLSLEMLREQGADGGRVAELEAEVDALDALVAEMLVASRLDMGATPLEIEALDVAELVEQAWPRVEAEAAQSGTELRCEVAPATRVLGDRALLVRVLGNLLENAVRYGEGQPVTVSAVAHDGRLAITVADRGPGVAEEALERLFEPFFRADRSRSRRTGGTGLGLMIVRLGVEALGGTVRAVPAEGGGLAVTFELQQA